MSKNTETKDPSAQGSALNISKRSFIIAIAIIFALMVTTYILTLVVPGGEYARTIDANGNTIIDTAGGFRYVAGGLPFWKWLLSPFLVLGAEGNGTIIAVMVFLLVIGGVFNSLNCCGLMQYMLVKIVYRFGHVRYTLMAVLTVFFMAMGSLVGSFEEVIPMVPIVVALSVSLGWDAVTGLAMSLLAAGCGFAAGVANPFTIGVAQGLAGLPTFSGMWLRFVSFLLIYGLLLLFIRFHAKKTEKPLQVAKEESGFEKNPRMDKALLYFACILGTGILLVLCSSFLPFLQAYTMIIVALMFLIGGLVAVSKSGMEKKKRWETFVSGVVSILPSILMILMASSIKYMMVEGKILDTMLHGAVQVASGLPKGGLIFVHLPNLPCNEFLHTLRFGQSVSADSSYCAACANIRSQRAALHRCICLRRRFQQCVLPNQSRASYFAEPWRSQLRRMGKVFRKISRAEPDIDKRYTAAWPGAGILTE